MSDGVLDLALLSFLCLLTISACSYTGKIKSLKSLISTLTLLISCFQVKFIFESEDQIRNSQKI